HPGLPAVDSLRGPSGRVFLVHDFLGDTLRQRFDECRSDGSPGIPRAELLSLLRSAAASLDELAQLHGMPHLAINPRNLRVRDDRVLLFEYGLVQLLWGAHGKPAGKLNVRYAAPELFEKTTSRTADQYSLALVYAEMLSGHHPRPGRVVSRSSAKTAAKMDLSMLPAFDRDIVIRALNAEPTRRDGSCQGLIRALEDAGGPGSG